MWSRSWVFQLFYDKKVTTLKSMEIMVYSVCAIILNVSNRRRQRLIGDGYTLVGFLPV